MAILHVFFSPWYSQTNKLKPYFPCNRTIWLPGDEEVCSEVEFLQYLSIYIPAYLKWNWLWLWLWLSWLWVQICLRSFLLSVQRRVAQHSIGEQRCQVGAAALKEVLRRNRQGITNLTNLEALFLHLSLYPTRSIFYRTCKLTESFHRNVSVVNVYMCWYWNTHLIAMFLF